MGGFGGKSKPMEETRYPEDTNTKTRYWFGEDNPMIGSKVVSVQAPSTLAGGIEGSQRKTTKTQSTKGYM